MSGGVNVPQEIVLLVGKQTIELELLRRERDQLIAERDSLPTEQPRMTPEQFKEQQAREWVGPNAVPSPPTD